MLLIIFIWWWLKNKHLKKNKKNCNKMYKISSSSVYVAKCITHCVLIQKDTHNIHNKSGIIGWWDKTKSCSKPASCICGNQSAISLLPLSSCSTSSNAPLTPHHPPKTIQIPSLLFTPLYWQLPPNNIMCFVFYDIRQIMSQANQLHSINSQMYIFLSVLSMLTWCFPPLYAIW